MEVEQPTRREKPVYRQEAQCWIGHEPARNHCGTVPNHYEVNHVTEQIKTLQIQCAEERDSPGAVYRADHAHKMQRPLKLPQVQHISKTGQKVQQSTEVSQQQYMDMHVDVPGEMQHQNTVKDAQMQRQVQMIQKMPSGIHRKVQNMLVPNSSDAALQSPSPVFQTSSRRQTSLIGSDVFGARGRERERERAREKGSMKAPQALSRRCTARLVKIFFRKEGAHTRPRTKSRQNPEMWGRPRKSARDTAEQEERAQQIASIIENLPPFAEAVTQRSWRTEQTQRIAFSPHRQQNALL